MTSLSTESTEIGSLFVRQKIITPTQLQSALALQQQKPHLRIGEILLSLNMISMEQLDTVLKKHLSTQMLGNLLLSKGLINAEQLSKTLEIHHQTGQRLGEIVIELGFITPYQLTQILDRQQAYRNLGWEDNPQRNSQLRKAKIIATLGPSCSDEHSMRQFIRDGVNVFRFNFSHGDHASHQKNITLLRQIAAEEAQIIALLQDIQGPKIRIGDVENGEANLTAGSRFNLQPETMLANSHTASVSYPRLLQDIIPGASILIDDGRIELRVREVTDSALITEVLNDGALKPRKGVNFPGSMLSISVLTEKDKIDLKFGVEQDFDWVAASFIQTANDILDVRQEITQHGGDIPIIAKIERQEAVKNLQEILAVTDGVMVARGDLGVELPTEDVPIIQKQIICQARLMGKPVITATQMLDSMVTSPRPTRAEASDVANAILDGTDAVMLSNETAAGNYPIEAVQMMRRIIQKTESAPRSSPNESLPASQRSLPEAIAIAAVQMITAIDGRAILVHSQYGDTARLIARYRPNCHIIAPSALPQACRRMSLIWGVYPVLIDAHNTPSLAELVPVSCEKKLLQKEDYVVLMETSIRGVSGTRGIFVAVA